MEVEELLLKAKELIEEPDFIVDAYDLTLQWTSPKFQKILGYDEAEIKDFQVLNLYADDPEKARQLQGDVLFGPQGAVREIPLKTKTGKRIQLKLKIFHLELEETPYLVAQIITLKDK